MIIGNDILEAAIGEIMNMHGPTHRLEATKLDCVLFTIKKSIDTYSFLKIVCTHTP
jgi:hypothetical protein